ncbi:hypothetical protein ACFXAZ_33560 [Streptomyces sp. NPDC059477]|uniref:hypothetical protein n=1 Tax=Streptomyces sp. NPDC059477 TaxID=3346847 RepID=UPI003692D668
MEAELLTLVGTGASTVVALMVTDAWERGKQQIVRLFARGDDQDPDTVAGELEETRATLVPTADTAYDEEVTAELTAAVRRRLRELLERDPGAVEELRRLVAEFAPAPKPDTPGAVYNNITGGTQLAPVVQGQTFNGLTFHVSTDTGPPRTD